MISEKELLSIVFVCQKIHKYLLGSQVIVGIDHKALSLLQECKLAYGHIARWVLPLQKYKLKIEYCNGSENVVVDALSRMNEGTEGSGLLDCKELYIWAINGNDWFKRKFKKLSDG